MSSFTSLPRRFITSHLREQQVRHLRTLWHRAQLLDPRRLWLHYAFRRLNADVAPGEMVLRPGLRLSVDPQAREPFEWFCFRSPEMVAELDGFLARAAGCRRLLDVGACHGLFSLVFTQGRPETRALAVEPSPLAYDILKGNIQRNAGAQITAVQAAVGAGGGRVRMRRVWHHFEAAPSTEESDTISVPLRTLDDIREELAFRPDVMKVDVEGYEIFALQGARRILAEDRPLLFLEVHAQQLQELGGSMRELWDLLAEVGYRAMDLRDHPVSAAGFAAVESIARFHFLPDRS
jgi:FkbM family methyltransferase